MNGLNFSLLKSKACSVFTAALLFLWFFPAVAQQTELENVKEQIKSHQANIKKQNEAIQAIEKELEVAEKEISKFAAKLNELNQESKQATSALHQLKLSAQTLEADKQKQQKLLAKQIASAYRTGKHDYLKVLLNQEDPTQIDRAISYYQYLNDARVKSLKRMQFTMTELSKNQQAQEQKLAELDNLKQQQKQQQKQLSNQQKEREAAVTELNNTIKGEQQQLHQLAEAEKHLSSKIKQTRKKLKKPKLEGLGKYKGKLRWPVKGKVLHSYGSHRRGQVRWKGILISAREGNNIRSVSHGQVIYSDYLKGYGMVMVIDHGNAYMSLYGHNQTLLKAVGDTIQRGEVIALAGRSGGQKRSGLYFEIRHKGEPQDPVKWLKKR
ncbi:murein hydrolase activator EnvC family protein [Motilimonas pumila]|uniref:Peptidase M23 n=1 Tax=Motilimonas pumila TaxID=2303987 RepID=A0A418YKV1_9GAMM|nr:peptidoglycan DD-metalloendopeptidase family protein [Motilimonas pumila]RJG51589.1 peptidase M23 [Motilimonas pumila]